MVKSPPADARDIRDMGLISGLGRSPGGGHGSPLQCSCLENPMDRKTWQAMVHRVAKSQTQLKRLSTHAYPIHIYMCVYIDVCVCVCVYNKQTYYKALGHRLMQLWSWQIQNL